MKDNEFYASGSHPEAGSPMVKIDGKWFSQVDLPNTPLPCKTSSPKSLERINNSSTSHVVDTDERKELLERLTLMKNQRARLLKDLERVNSVIKSIETDLSI